MAFGLFYGKKLYHYLKEKSTGYTILSNNPVDKDGLRGLKYFDGSGFIVRGKYHHEQNYNRLPAKFENIVRPELWELSKNSAGISIWFTTNSPILSVKWELMNNKCPASMNRIAANGLDLYCFLNGNWQYAGSAVPTGFRNECLLVSEMDSSDKMFMLNLPLCDGVKNLQVGIDQRFKISSPVKGEADKGNKPIVIYGTSITQGGSASRPGMTYPSILSRKLNTEIINLGFRANGMFEESVGQVLCDIDAELYVIDCVPNSSPETIRKNALKLVRQIMECKPKTPILLIESIIREQSFFRKNDDVTFAGSKFIQEQNNELSRSFDGAINLGIKDLYYLESENLIGSDHEGTVDGTHLSDLGQVRLAEKIETKIKEILNSGLN